MTSRLAVAFTGVALLAVLVLGVLTLAAARDEVGALVEERNERTAVAVQTALEDAHRESGSWETAALHAARSLARAAGASLEVRDATGALVRGGGHGPMAMEHAETAPDALGDARTVTLVVDGRTVGTALIRFPEATPAPEREVRDALGRTVLWGSLLAAAAALGVGTLVARRIARPLRTLTRTAHALEAGDRSARARLEREPAELGELAAAFDRMADAVEQEDELRRALTADVAHELRTPVTIARAELEALVDGVVEPTPERLRSLHDETIRLERIIDDLATIASARAAGLQLERRPLDLADVARSELAALAPGAEAAGVDVTSALAPAPVEGDAARLAQVVRNLVGNALKFTPSGGTVDVRVEPVDGHVRLTVEDTGPGLDADELPHVFERFWRGRAGAGSAGSGIGLAVVAALVEAHGGAVDASNREGRGSRFAVTLPRA